MLSTGTQRKNSFVSGRGVCVVFVLPLNINICYAYESAMCDTCTAFRKKLTIGSGLVGAEVGFARAEIIVTSLIV